jgi:hypothetical protein
MLMDVPRLKETALSQVSTTPENGDTIPVDTVPGQTRTLRQGTGLAVSALNSSPVLPQALHQGTASLANVTSITD